MNKHGIQTQYQSRNALEDIKFKTLVHEFINTLKPSYNKVNITMILNQFHLFCLEDENLKSKKECTLLIEKITLNHIIKFQQIIELRVNNDEISKSYASNLLFYISLFFRFLSKKNIVNLFYKPLNYLQSKKKNNDKSEATIIFDFIKYLNNKNCTNINNYVKQVKSFIKYHELNVQDLNTSISEKHIRNYEEMIRKRVVKEEITPASAYQYLKAIRKFIDFLYKEKFIDFRYKIPDSLINNSKRSNEYVENKYILQVLEKIIECSINCLRDLSIFLIIFETGCRPLEVVNIQIDKIIWTERLITFSSKKSNDRTLQISSEAFEFIQSYMVIRRNYQPSINEKSLFLDFRGEQINTTTILDIFRSNNLRAFNEVIFTPKSLRHTFITNALNNENKIEKVAEIVGHKHQSSTFYYFYRDIRSINKIISEKDLNIKGVKN